VKDSFYATPGFNFYNITKLLMLQKTQKNIVPNVTNSQFSTYNETSFLGDDFITELETDKSMRIKFKPGYSTI